MSTARRSLIAALIFCCCLKGAGQEPSTEGSFTLRLQSNSIEPPLFDSDYASTLSIFFGQSLPNGQQLTLFGTRSHPAPNAYLTLELANVELGDGQADFVLGDTGTVSLKPPRLGALGLDPGSLRVQGISGRWTGPGEAAQLSFGRQRFKLTLPGGRIAEESLLLDGSWLEQRGRNAFGGGFTIAWNPIYLSPDRTDSSAELFSLRYVREVRPYVHAYGDAAVATDGAIAARVGAAGRLQNGDWNAAAFSHDRDLPLLYPVYRPGDSGVSLSGTYRLSYDSRISGGVTWLDTSSLTQSSSFRTNANFQKSFGDDRPTLTLSWDYNDVIYEFLDGGDIGRFGNRYTATLREFDRFNSWALAFNHSDDTSGERSQLLGSYRKLLDTFSQLDTYALAQVDEIDHVGITAELIYEREWRPNWSYRAGLGGTWLDEEVERAEGVAILGIVRKNIRHGWYGRVDLTLPFDVGLPSSDRVEQSFRVGIGTSYYWSDVSELRQIIAPVLDRNAFGSVSGIVRTEEGEPVAGAVILVEGRPRARSGSDGTFVVSRVPVGEQTITVDPISIDPGLVILETEGIDVVVEPRAEATAFFTLRRAVSLFGSLVRCRDGALEPVGGTALALIGPGGAYPMRTTNTGSFALDGVTPGVYDLIINPTDELEGVEIPEITIDLTRDKLGYVVRIGCDESAQQ